MQIEPNKTSDIYFQRDILDKFIINKLINKTVKCPICDYSNISLIENNTNNNPSIS